MKRVALLMAVVWHVHGLQSISQIEELAPCADNVRVYSPGVMSFVLKPQDDGSIWVDKTSLSEERASKDVFKLHVNAEIHPKILLVNQSSKERVDLKDGSIQALFETFVPGVQWGDAKLSLQFKKWNFFQPFLMPEVGEVQIEGCRRVPYLDTRCFPNLTCLKTSGVGFFWMPQYPPRIENLVSDFSVYVDNDGASGMTQLSEYTAKFHIENPDATQVKPILFKTESSSAVDQETESACSPDHYSTDNTFKLSQLMVSLPITDPQDVLNWHNRLSGDTKVADDLKDDDRLCLGAFFMMLPPEMKNNIFYFFDPLTKFLFRRAFGHNGSWSWSIEAIKAPKFPVTVLTMNDVLGDLEVNPTIASTFELLGSRKGQEISQTVHQTIVSTPLWKTDDGFLTEVSQTKRQDISGFFDDVPVAPDAFRVCVSWRHEQGKAPFFKVPPFFLHVTKKDDSFTPPVLSDGTRAKQLMTLLMLGRWNETMEPKFDAHPLEAKQDVEGVPLKSVPLSDAGQSDLTSQTPQTSFEALSLSSSHQQAASSADVSAAQVQPPQETSYKYDYSWSHYWQHS